MKSYSIGLILIALLAAGCGGNAERKANELPAKNPDLQIETVTKGPGGKKIIQTKDGKQINYEVVDEKIPPILRSYKIGPGDNLELLVQRFEGGNVPLSGNMVLELEDFAGMEYTHYQVMVDPMGNINLPLVGEVSVANLSAKQVEEQTIKKLQTYIVNPKVAVKIMSYASYSISVYGEVKNPGRHEIKKPVTLSEALALGGGITNDGSMNRIFIGRRGQTNKSINITAVWDRGGMDDEIILERDDVVFVPPRLWIRWEELALVVSIASSLSNLYFQWK